MLEECVSKVKPRMKNGGSFLTDANELGGALERG